jgi:hypothetical protein
MSPLLRRTLVALVCIQMLLALVCALFFGAWAYIGNDPKLQLVRDLPSAIERIRILHESKRTVIAWCAYVSGLQFALLVTFVTLLLVRKHDTTGSENRAS